MQTDNSIQYGAIWPRGDTPMNIVVLLKQVPDTEALIRLEDDGLSVNTSDLKWVINPYDEYAVEEALRIRDAHGGAVTVIVLGPERVVEAIRTALAMGADTAVRVDDAGLEGADALGIAKLLASAVQKNSCDLVICGQRAVDDDNFQVGAAVAQYLGIPQISMATKVEIDGQSMKCHRTVDGGTVVTQTSLPALVTTQKGLNDPRFASMMGIMKAKKKPIEVLTAQDLGLDADQVGASAAKVRIKGLSLPPERTQGKTITGDSPQELATELVKALQEAKII